MNEAQKHALADAITVLRDIQRQLAQGAAVHAGALLSANDDTIQDNIDAVLLNIDRAFPEVR